MMVIVKKCFLSMKGVIFMFVINNPVNFRDLGGKVGYNGRKVKSRKLLRSGQLTNLSDKEKTILLDEYNLKNIVDFRDAKEVVNKPNDNLGDIDYFHINIMKDTKVKVVNMENAQEYLHAEEMRQFMLDVYEEIMLNDTAHKGYSDFVNLLLQENSGSTLFHCFAGKDRTGIGAAIVLHILGISQEEILSDYLLTNEKRKEANMQIINSLKEKGLPEEGQEAFLVALSVEKEYLLSAFDVARKEYGSFDKYIQKALQIGVDEQEELRQIYLE